MVHEDEIRKIISETAGTTQAYRIKEILTYVADKKRYINIDCLFSKQTSIEDAHKIASEIEEKVKAHFAETIVTVHMETE
jgi:divalent metal cation (Fe/Co/Zn/Cd) transporter